MEKFVGETTTTTTTAITMKKLKNHSMLDIKGGKRLNFKLILKSVYVLLIHFCQFHTHRTDNIKAYKSMVDAFIPAIRILRISYIF